MPQREARWQAMTRIHYLGDEVTGAGFRLAGAIVQPVVAAAANPMADGARDDTGSSMAPEAALADALASADLVLVSADIWSRLRAEVRDAAQASTEPLVLVVPDRSGARGTDLARRLREQLGLA